MSAGFEPEILQDFLTESGELLDELEGDLVELESTPNDLELLNKAFRALHTIKGSASFLELTELVDIAHAAETALNAARSGELVVSREVMDLFLQSVDHVKEHMGQLGAGESLTTPDPALVSALIAASEGGTSSETESASVATATEDAPCEGPEGSDDGERDLNLPDNKADLLDFLLSDLNDTISSVHERLGELDDQTARGPAGVAISELGEALGRSAEFFEHEPIAQIGAMLNRAGGELSEMTDDLAQQAGSILAEVEGALRTHAEAIGRGKIAAVDLSTLFDRFDSTLSGEEPENTPQPDAPGSPTEPADSAQPETPKADASREKPSQPDAPKAPARTTTIEQTIRVEVGRLESLMNLVGELVLQKNRINALSRTLDIQSGADQELLEDVTEAAGGLDRVTSDIQVAVMRTRMQPLDKLFGKYPRLIRDLANKTGKKIRLNIEGGETEVDKSVIEELGDPLVHLLRNASDHGLEPPQERTDAGKEETGTISIVATHEGSHVLIRIMDDGRGMDPDRIARKAVEKGLTTEHEAQALSDNEKLRFILAAGFSTADQVSDLSGRGVGMDVVKTNIEKLKGEIDVDSKLGNGSCLSITIPLTVAIMPAMMVEIGSETYAVPLGNIVEIVRPEDASIGSIKGKPVLMIRDSVLPLLNALDVFGVPDTARKESPFALVLQQAGRTFALRVSALIGQQEVVIKPLDSMVDRKGPISGATVRDDGGVSLIVDVGELARSGENLATMAKTPQSGAESADHQPGAGTPA